MEKDAIKAVREALDEWKNLPDEADISGLVDLSFGHLRYLLLIAERAVQAEP